jgi:tetratricopeptide (TPR) repeat protein
MGRPDAALADYNSALGIEPQLATALYGRGRTKLRQGDLTGGNADIATAIAINPQIQTEFARYGVK